MYSNTCKNMIITMRSNINVRKRVQIILHLRYRKIDKIVFIQI